MTTDRLCRVCGSETELVLCSACVGEIEAALTDLPADLDDLEAVMAREARGPMGLGDPHRYWTPEQTAEYDAEMDQLPAWLRSMHGPTALPETPWPFAPGAADLRWTTWNTLTTWVRHLFETRGVGIPDGPACRACSHWTCQFIRSRHDARGLLLLLLDTVAVDEAAAQLHDEVTWLHRAVDKATLGRREADIYAGPCDLADVRVDLTDDGTLAPHLATCGAELYAREGDDEVACQACGAVYDLAERKAYLADQVDDQWARPHIIANGLTSLDEPIKPDTLYKWIERGIIKRVAHDVDGHSLYRVGDVRARIALMRDRKDLRASA